MIREDIFLVFLTKLTFESFWSKFEQKHGSHVEGYLGSVDRSSLGRGEIVEMSMNYLRHSGDNGSAERNVVC